MSSAFNNPDKVASNKTDESLIKFINSLDEGFELLDLIFDQQGNVVDFIFLEVNPAYERQTGLKATDIIGKRKKENAPASEQRWYDYAIQAVKTGKTLSYQYYNDKVNGYFDTQFIPISTNRIAVLFKDVTEHRKTEEILYKNQHELDRILNSSPTIIFYKDKEGKFIQVNRAFAESLKTSKDNLLNKTVFDLNSVEIAQGMTNDDQEVLESKCPKLGIIEPYNSPTGIRWIRTDKIPTIDEKGDVIGLIGFSEDITERKKAEEDSSRNSRRIKEILESISDDFMVLDRNWNFVYANSQAANLVGLEPEGIVGKNFWELFPQNRGTYIEQSLREAMEKKEVKRFELVGQYSHRHKLITTYPSVDGIVLIATDITERKLLEQQLKEKDRLATIGATAGMVGHDIRNPLQAIVSELFLARQAMAEAPKNTDTREALESINLIQEQVDYISKIVSDLQDFARPLMPEYADVSVEDLLVKVFETIVVPDKVTLKVDVQSVVSFKTDATFIKRALTNLINNAIQAMPDGGELALTAYSKEKSVFITVADTGDGIAEDVKPNLFKPLMTTKAKGQGLGLAVVKRLVEGLNGTVSFESEKDKGTKFTIELPLKVEIPSSEF